MVRQLEPIEERVSRFTPTATMHWADLLDRATSEIAVDSKFGIDATRKLPGKGFKHAWLPLIKMDAAVKAKVEGFSLRSSNESPGY